MVRNFRFPIPGDPTFQKCLKNTIIDGEFVLDKEPDGTVRICIFIVEISGLTPFISLFRHN